MGIIILGPICVEVVPDKGPITWTYAGGAVPAFVCQDAPTNNIAATVPNATSLTIARVPVGSGAFATNLLTGNKTRTRSFNHNPAFFGTITFTATFNGCTGGVFGPVMTADQTLDVRRALDDPLVEATLIAGPNNVCEGDAAVYTASNSRAFGNPLFSFSESDPAAVASFGRGDVRHPLPHGPSGPLRPMAPHRDDRQVVRRFRGPLECHDRVAYRCHQGVGGAVARRRDGRDEPVVAETITGRPDRVGYAVRVEEQRVARIEGRLDLRRADRGECAHQHPRLADSP